jgi:hypothetical protein
MLASIRIHYLNILQPFIILVSPSHTWYERPMVIMYSQPTIGATKYLFCAKLPRHNTPSVIRDY